MAVAALENLTVRYGRKTAVSDLTVEIPEGCVGLLGPNGAGKTTLLKTLLGFLNPASGRGSVLGLDVGRQGLQIRQRVGLMPESECHIPGMNAVSFVAYAGELVGMPAAQALRRAHEVLEYCKLGEARYRAVDTYSTGMKQRIKLAQAMVHGPKLLFLDEPTNGLDPEGRDEMLTLIRDITHGKDVNVVVSSHLLPDIERTCDRIVMMKAGRVAMQGEIAELRGSGSDQLDVELRERSIAFQHAIDAAGGHIVHALGSKVRLTLPPGTPNPARALFTAARESNAQIRGFSTARRSLEDVFLEAVE